jgi:hypothetical protein
MSDKHQFTHVPSLKKIHVDNSPAQSAAAKWWFSDTKGRHVELDQPDSDRMIFRVNAGYGVFLFFTILALVGLAVAAYTGAFGDQGFVVFIGLGMILGVCVLFVGIIYLACPRWTFCRSTGRLTCKHIWNRQEIPLCKIIAIQVCFGGVFGSEDSEGPSPYETYQLNLVLSDLEGSRLNLTHHADWEWTLQAGLLLADFLEVPLINCKRDA